MHKLLLFTHVYTISVSKKFNFVVFHQAYAYHTHSEAFSRILQGYLTHFHQNRLASLISGSCDRQRWFTSIAGQALCYPEPCKSFLRLLKYYAKFLSNLANSKGEECYNVVWTPCEWNQNMLFNHLFARAYSVRCSVFQCHLLFHRYYLLCYSVVKFSSIFVSFIVESLLML